MEEINVKVKYKAGVKFYTLGDDNKIGIVTIEGFHVIGIGDKVPKVYYYTTSGYDYKQEELFKTKEEVLKVINTKHQEEIKEALMILNGNPLNK